MNEVYLPISTNQTQNYINLDVTKFVSDDNPDVSKHPKLDICNSIPNNIIIESNKFLTPINIYPNPSNGNVTISLNKILNNSILKIVNSIGQELFNKQLEQLELQKNINLLLPSGIYFIRLNNLKIEYSQIIIVN